MSDLRPIDPPDLQPLRESHEANQLEAELKEVFLAVFETHLRERERRLNLYGMPHLGDNELIERALKEYGLAIVRRDNTRTSFLLKAARSRNPRRGMIFLRQYLQSVWPNVWKVEPLWHPVALAHEYPEHRRPLSQTDLGGGVSAVYDPESNDGLPTVYQTDWQGKTQLYPFARTNLIPNSAATDGWVLGENTVVVQNKTLVGPDGITPASSYQGNGVMGWEYVAAPAATSLKANTWYTVSVWIRLINGNAPTDGSALVVDYSGGPSDPNARSYVQYATNEPLTTDWTRYSTTFLNVEEGAKSTTYVHVDTSSSAEISPSGVMYEEGRTATRLIPTTGAAASFTDYTMDGNGVATFGGEVTTPSPLTMFRTGRIRVTLPVTTDNGLGLVEIAKAFRSTLAARLMLELQLSTVFENIGDGGGLALANGATGVMPFMATGTLSI